jgi:hypothetical protein
MFTAEAIVLEILLTIGVLVVWFQGHLLGVRWMALKILDLQSRRLQEQLEAYQDSEWEIADDREEWQQD